MVDLFIRGGIMKEDTKGKQLFTVVGYDYLGAFRLKISNIEGELGNDPELYAQTFLESIPLRKRRRVADCFFVAVFLQGSKTSFLITKKNNPPEWQWAGNSEHILLYFGKGVGYLENDGYDGDGHRTKYRFIRSYGSPIVMGREMLEVIELSCDYTKTKRQAYVLVSIPVLVLGLDVVASGPSIKPLSLDWLTGLALLMAKGYSKGVPEPEISIDPVSHELQLQWTCLHGSPRVNVKREKAKGGGYEMHLEMRDSQRIANSVVVVYEAHLIEFYKDIWNTSMAWQIDAHLEKEQ